VGADVGTRVGVPVAFGGNGVGATVGIKLGASVGQDVGAYVSVACTDWA
jgi:hypothetical protein